ncbi:MAG: lysylphosphatidylglycerol synthase transmembrane domain-containing protein [Candidatus Krumholzibacteriia bacterium]
MVTWRRHGIFLVRGLVSAALVWWLLGRLSWEEIESGLERPRWGVLALALGIYAVSALGGALQWIWLLRRAGLATPAAEIRRLYFIGLFFNNFLPANVGGDAYKIVDLGRREQCPARVFCATLLDRLLGLTALTVLAVLAAAAAAAGGHELPPAVVLLAPVLAALILVQALLLSRRVGARLPLLARRVRLGQVGERLATVATEWQVFRRAPLWLLAVGAFSVGVQFLRILTHIVVAAGLGILLTPTQVLQLFVLIPLLAVSLTLPVTINGIGLRESVSATLLVEAGLTAEEAVAVEVAAYVVQVVFSLWGGVLFWLGRRPRAPVRDVPDLP